MAAKAAFGARVDVMVDDEAEENDAKAEFGLLGVGPLEEVVQRIRVIGRPWRWIARWRRMIPGTDNFSSLPGNLL